MVLPMADVTPLVSAEVSRPILAHARAWTRKTQAGDKIYRADLTFAALSVLLIIIGLIYELVSGSRASLAAFGLGFFTNSKWDPNGGTFGALPFILGTLYSSFWALVLALPIGVFTAIFLSEMSPRWLER